MEKFCWRLSFKLSKVWSPGFSDDISKYHRFSRNRVGWMWNSTTPRLVKTKRAMLLGSHLCCEQTKKLHISLLLSAACLSCLQRNRQEGKLLAQVCALKHFHLCNKIAERAAPLHWAGQSKTLRSTKWWTAMRLLLQHDWLCLLGHSGVSCVKWSPLWRRIGPASALMQKIILSASRERDERADM